jgi:hypothetical protein
LVSAKTLVRSPRTIGDAPSSTAYSGSSGSMIATPIWVTKAIAASRASERSRPRPSSARREGRGKIVALATTADAVPSGPPSSAADVAVGAAWSVDGSGTERV